MRVVLFVLIDYCLQMFESVLEPTLLERDTAQLEMRVGFLRIDRHRRLELLDRLGILPALLINKPQLIPRLGVMRINRRRLQHPAEILALPKSRAEVRELAAQ